MLRTRPVPPEIAELIAIANKLPRARGASHDRVVNSHVHEIDDEALRYFLGRAIEQLPTELEVFVKPDDGLLENSAEGWKNILGPVLFGCAIGASDGLLCPEPLTVRELESRRGLEARGLISFPHQGKAFFGAGELKAMHQRYLFLFAVREILHAASRAHVSLDEARHRLLLYQSYSNPSSALSQVESLRGRFEINKSGKNKTHKLGYAKPATIWILEEIEAERIRECEVCERLFWAGRLDQSACRPQCSNVLRARRWREKYDPKHRVRQQKAVGASRVKPTAKKRRKAI